MTHPRPTKGLNVIRFESLASRHRHRVYSYACHYLGDPDEAADVTQEVLIRMWKNREAIDEERVLAWLLRVTRNACVDALRKRTAYRKHVSTSTEIVDLQTDSEPGPDRQASSSLFTARLRKALEQLEEPHRSIVILREIEGYKYEEISQSLDLPLNTVKVYLHRARKALRKYLSEVSRYEYT